MREIKRIAADMGVPIVLFPDTSDVVDTPQTGTYKMYPDEARLPNQCSGGQGQRVALGRTILANPRLLLLDEPLSRLDLALKQEILPYIARVRDLAGIPILMVTHDAQEAVPVTDSFLLLRSGRCVWHGDPPPLRYNTLLPVMPDSASA